MLLEARVLALLVNDSPFLMLLMTPYISRTSSSTDLNSDHG